MRSVVGILGLFFAVFAPSKLVVAAELQTVPYVNVERYMGTWYEIATIPQSFQRGCVATTANYTLRADGRVDVVNECRKNSLDGPLDTAHGLARVVDTSTNAKLKVRFFWFIWGDYWIIDLGDDYEFAVVGHPSRDYLWILSRTPSLPDDVLTGILDRLKNVHEYDVSRLKYTLQPSL